MKIAKILKIFATAGIEIGKPSLKGGDEQTLSVATDETGVQIRSTFKKLAKTNGWDLDLEGGKIDVRIFDEDTNIVTTFLFNLRKHEVEVAQLDEDAGKVEPEDEDHDGTVSSGMSLTFDEIKKGMSVSIIAEEEQDTFTAEVTAKTPSKFIVKADDTGELITYLKDSFNEIEVYEYEEEEAPVAAPKKEGRDPTEVEVGDTITVETDDETLTGEVLTIKGTLRFTLEDEEGVKHSLKFADVTILDGDELPEDLAEVDVTALMERMEALETAMKSLQKKVAKMSKA